MRPPQGVAVLALFLNLDSEELKMMVLCCLPSISAVKVDQQPEVSVEYHKMELLQSSAGFRTDERDV